MENTKKTKKYVEEQYYRKRLHLGYDETGKRIDKDFYGKTIKEAEAKREAYRIAHGRSVDNEILKKRFSVVADLWFRYKIATPIRGNQRIGNSQQKNYRCYLNQINHHIGSMPVFKITSVNIYDIIYSLAICNPNTGKPASITYIRDVYGTVKQIFDWLEISFKMKNNPTDNITLPAATKSVRQPITEEQAETIRSLCGSGHRMQPAAMLMLCLGMRRGEVVALRWNKVDFEDNSVTIDSSVDYTKNQPQVKSTKTIASMRKIYMPNEIRNYLLQISKESKSQYVCPSAKGKIMSESSWRRGWDSYCLLVDRTIRQAKGEQLKSINSPDNKIAMSPMTPHQLRHYCATEMHLKGVPPKTVQAILGHASFATTMGIYTHGDSEKAKKDAVEILNK